ncbi:hypothetical protein [Paraburkholderia acidiphila]|uniref:Uncharacterized protein n=1 Tax=Paraburkholderia acidiphila TaxID=2571747 RepID=A0A7Z2G9L7_9BURK|nr:hypothetical protein [Paraburkholderia acidiphila]QGZ57733.1 hypothetical protein FAZ97_22870 [Paraburkholderia acidiphila]
MNVTPASDHCFVQSPCWLEALGVGLHHNPFSVISDRSMAIWSHWLTTDAVIDLTASGRRRIHPLSFDATKSPLATANGLNDS